jgi:hypothetical protein
MKNPKAMSMETAYTKPLVCKMWALFGKYAGAHGYGVINNYDCSAYSQKDAIKNVVIGSLVRCVFYFVETFLYHFKL